MVTFRNNSTGRRNNYRRNDRNFKNNGIEKNKFSSNFTNNDTFHRKLPGRNNHNAAKLLEKYNDMAREALSTGDKILSENYFQHADHFSRIVADVNTSNKDNNPTQGENQTKIITPNVNNNEVSQVEEKQKKEEIKK